MDTLNLLWELEKHNIVLSEYEIKLKVLEDNTKNEEAQKRLNDIKIKSYKLRHRLENINDKIRKTESQLKEYEFLYKEKKRLLYQGNIIDIKQLEQLDREEKQIKEIIDELEIGVIKNLQEVDLIEKDLNDIESQIIIMENYIEDGFIKNKSEIANLEEIIYNLNKDIANISSRIDKKALNLYQKIKSQKLNPIVALRDNICLGCNMRIPTYQRKYLNEGKEIILCESCGRILYMERK